MSGGHWLRSGFTTATISLLLSWLTAAAGPALDYPVGHQWREPHLEGFYFPERQSHRQFRWSAPEAALRLQGLAGNRRYSLVVEAATRHPRTPVQAAFHLGPQNHLVQVPWDFATLRVGEFETGWSLTGRTRLLLAVEGFGAPPDPRDLGLMVSRVRLQPVPRLQLSAIPPPLPAVWLALHATGLALIAIRLGWALGPALALALAWRAGYAALELAQPERFAGWFTPAVSATALAALGVWVLGRMAVRRLPSLQERLALGATGALGLLGALAAYHRILLPQGPLGWDEADHTMWAHWTAEALRRWDLLELWGLAHRQHFWPPLYSWWQGAVFLVFGESEVTARLGPLIALVAVCLLVGWITLRLERPYAPALAVGAVLLCAASPRLLTFSSLAMFELPVAVFILITLAGLQRALVREQSRAYALAGGLGFLLFLAKFNYALMILAAFGLYELLEGRLRPSLSAERISLHLDRRQAAFWAVSLLLILAWFAVEPVRKLNGFLGFVTNQSSGYPFWSATNLLFYPRSWILEYLPHPTLAILALPLALVGIGRSRPGFERLLVLFVLIGFLAGTLHPLKAERYITPLVPAAAIVVMIGLAEALARVPFGRLARASFLPAAAGALLGLALLVSGLARLEPWHFPGAAGAVLRDALKRVETGVQPARPVLFLGTFAELSGALLEWHLLTQTARAPGSVEFDPYGPVDSLETAREVLAQLLEDRPHHLVVAIEVAPGIGFDLPDYRQVHAWKRVYLEAMRDTPGWQVAWQASYPAFGLRLVAYERGA